MKKILKEFKAFITRGNVLDLAVGMIIGAAFTAIVSALVNNIFKPLINAIPMGDMSGLITMLVAKDADGATIVAGSGAVIDMSKSIYIDWGAFIMAIVNFLITAIVLFTIIKLINTFRDGMNDYKINLDKTEIKSLRAQGMSHKQIKAYAAQKAAEEAAAKAEEAKANAPETAEQLLKDIRELLRASQNALPQSEEKETSENK